MNMEASNQAWYETNDRLKPSWAFRTRTAVRQHFQHFCRIKSLFKNKISNKEQQGTTTYLEYSNPGCSDKCYHDQSSKTKLGQLDSQDIAINENLLLCLVFSWSRQIDTLN